MTPGTEASTDPVVTDATSGGSNKGVKNLNAGRNVCSTVGKGLHRTEVWVLSQMFDLQKHNKLKDKLQGPRTLN